MLQVQHPMWDVNRRSLIKRLIGGDLVIHGKPLYFAAVLFLEHRGHRTVYSAELRLDVRKWVRFENVYPIFGGVWVHPRKKRGSLFLHGLRRHRDFGANIFATKQATEKRKKLNNRASSCPAKAKDWPRRLRLCDAISQ